MKYKLRDLIDMGHFQNLQDRINEIYSFPSAIIDNEGNILTATAWQEVCTQFHRKNKDCERDCIESDQYIQSHLHEASPAVSYRCPRGLVDNATPIIIDDVHYGNFFTGQFFLEKPDMEFFRGQAKKYGFDEDAYLEAVKKVPIWTQEQLDSYLFFIKGLIAVISESGLKKLKETESRKQIEDSEQHHRTILQTAMDGIWRVDLQGRLLEVNEAYCRMSGYSEQELLAMRISDLEEFETSDETSVHIKKIMAQGEDRFESRHRRKDGSMFDVEVSVKCRPIEGGQLVAFLRDITERKRAAEELQQSHDMIVKLTAQVPGVVYQYRLYPDGRSSFPFSSPGMNSIYEVTPEDVREDATPVFGRLHPDDYDRIVASIQESALTLQPFHCEFRVVLPRQGLRWRLSDALPERTEDGGTLWHGIISDITDRKQAEQEIAILAEIGRMVSSTLDINQVYERVATEARKLIPYDRLLVNRKITPNGQFIAAYVSGIDNPRRRMGDLYPSQGSATGVVMKTRAGIIIQPTDAEEIKDLYPNLYETFKTGLRSTMSVPLISMDEVIGSMNFRSEKLKAYTEKDLRLAERIGMQIAGAIANAQIFDDLSKTEKSLRESNELFSLFMHHSPIYTFIKEVTPTESIVLQASDNYRQMIGTPGCEMVGKTMAELFSPEFGAKITADDWAVVSRGAELRLDEELNGRSFTTIKFPIIREDKTLLAGYTIDITDRKRADKQLQDTLENLRKAVGTTIQVLVSAVEARDPYTSGHQIRSANLARAVAMEMGLPQDKIDAIRMAGSIHDIGKLSIPAEILSKPTKLSELEFSLIKEHARQGFEMLKSVESPWPLAEIVHQHHERMDGSGYPRNLKGDEICMEARILAVADVVEAMASHRPYRAGLGIDTALDEIEKNRGIFYDDAVAEACLRLFNEKGYKFE